MGKLMVFEWMSLDGVFDADLMNEWWEPYDSAERQQSIQGVYLDTTAFLMGRRSYEMLAPHWSPWPTMRWGDRREAQQHAEIRCLWKRPRGFVAELDCRARRQGCAARYRADQG